MLVGLVAGQTHRNQAADDWITEQRALAAQDRLFPAVPMFLASATSRP
ncbi:hypothetical protein ABT063_49035 [Streptomyces sp. NPDC002838]